MKRNFTALLFAAVLSFYSCRKESSIVPTDQSLETDVNDYHIFAKSFAKVIENNEVKLLLKNNALKKIDGDYDVLIKDFVILKLKDGKSILDLLVDQNSEIKSIVDQNPLLTVFVPELETFNASNWDTEKTTPIVAVRNLTSDTDEVIAYNNQSKILKLQRTKAPDIPTILIKKNEIVPFLNDKDVQIVKAKSFNKTATISGRTSSERNWRSLDPLAPRVLEAINKNIPLSNIRDYVYYGLDPNNNVNKSELTGYDYAEHIISIELTDKLVLDKIADWGEGNLEIKITVNILQKSGSPLQINKVIFCTKEDLYQAPTDRNAGYLKPFVGFDPIQIATWDNYTLGNLWLFHVEEYDNGEERTETQNIENTFTTEGGGSFEVGIDKIFKLGFSAKTSSVEKKSHSFSIKSTNNSDNLYDALLNYLEPVAKLEINTRGYYVYKPYYLNTGAIKIRVEPYPTGGIPQTNTDGGSTPRTTGPTRSR